MKPTQMPLPGIIYLMGIDGSGKTTIAEAVKSRIERAGYRTSYIWLRFNHFLTKPLLAYGRLAGLTRYTTISGVQIGYHEFYKSRWVPWTFILLQYLDNLIACRLLLRSRSFRNIVICDRFIYDTLIDLSVETDKPDLYKGRIGRYFSGILPRGTLTLHVSRRMEDILSVRPESKEDMFFLKRMELYNTLPDFFGIPTIHNDGPLSDTLQSVFSSIGIG